MIRKPRKTAGVIGLGTIGSRVAAGLRAAGFQTYVWNRTPQPVPNFLASPGEVAGATDFIQIFVSDAQALFDVLESLRDRLTPNHVIMCCSTVGPDAAIDAAELVQQTGARYLDAPFTGSRDAADRRQLVYYVGGEDAVYLRAKPVLEATSKAIVRMGAVGDASILKVVTNMISAVSIQALAEALAIVRKAGLPDEILGAALEHNGCRSGTMDLKLPKMVAGDYEPHFALKHMFKDMQLGIQMANALQLDCPVASVTAGALFGGIKKGWGELDSAAIFKVYEDTRAHHRGLGVAAEPTPAEALNAPEAGAAKAGEAGAVAGIGAGAGPVAAAEAGGKAGVGAGDESRAAEEAEAAAVLEQLEGSAGTGVGGLAGEAFLEAAQAGEGAKGEEAKGAGENADGEGEKGEGKGAKQAKNGPGVPGAEEVPPGAKEPVGENAPGAMEKPSGEPKPGGEKLSEDVPQPATPGEGTGDKAEGT